MKKITIFGLGYVGLPLLCALASRNIPVMGYDTDQKKISLLAEGKSPINDEQLVTQLKTLRGKYVVTSDEQKAVSESDILVICVPTPINENLQPDLNYVVAVAETIARHLKKGQLIILESTVAPGTCETIFPPLLEGKTELKHMKDFHLAHCPERIDPGNKKYGLESIPRVVGATDPLGLQMAMDFYHSFLKADVHPLSSIKAAEAVKIIENTFRDINIAFVNELAQSFDKLGVDIVEVIRGASTKPFGFLPHWPGCGVGGHCIAVDPYYLIEKAKEVGFQHKFLSLAREINRGMPAYTLQRLEEGLAQAKLSLKKVSICVLGLAYKPNVDDTRESPAFELMHLLKEQGIQVNVFDPYVKDQSSVKELEQALKHDVIILATGHDLFTGISGEQFKKSGVKVIVDGRNCLDKAAIKSVGIVYKGIGRE